jgi:O-antigen/teichoic acid export membrane protein
MLLKVIAWKSSFLPEGSLRARLAIGAFWSIVGALFGQGLRLLSNIVIARSLGKTGFGEYGMIISTVGLIAGLGGVGIGVSVAKHVAEYRTSNPV